MFYRDHRTHIVDGEQPRRPYAAGTHMPVVATIGDRGTVRIVIGQLARMFTQPVVDATATEVT